MNKPPIRQLFPRTKSCKLFRTYLSPYIRFLVYYHDKHCLQTTPATTTTESAELLELPTPVVPLWLPLPILMLFTAAFNVGMGSLTWTVATEMLPVRDGSTMSRDKSCNSENC